MNQLRIKYGKDYEQPTAVPMLTDGYNLPAKKVIHIVGPIVSQGTSFASQYKLTPALENDLADCYRNTLDKRERIKNCGFLLHFHRGISFSESEGCSDRSSDRDGMDGSTSGSHGKGDLQCF